MEKALEPRVEVEVHLLNEAPLAFQYRVLQTGQLLFVREEVKRIRYEAEKMSDYLDYKPVLEWFNRRYLERSRGGMWKESWPTCARLRRRWPIGAATGRN